MHSEFGIIGSGFSGSLLAWILARAGRSVRIIDRAMHPRFAIGESSTPLADMLLQQIGHRFNLPELLPLATWGSWQARYPHLRAGKKRGFSYFEHKPHQRFSESADHESSLLVAASASDESSDTHWMRSDVDAWVSDQAVKAGSLLSENFLDASVASTDSGWRVRGLRSGENIEFTCDFLVDASGGGSVLARSLGLDRHDHRLQTRNGALFGHFRNVGSMTQWQGAHGLPMSDDPFDADDAAQHHLLENGWLWMLRFSEGTTSVGIVQPTDIWLKNQNTDAQRENWQAMIERYPSVSELMEQATLVAPLSSAGVPRCGWLPMIGRLWSQAAGRSWAMLPGTAGVVDPLHSTGIAHGLSGVYRLAGILLDNAAHRELALNVYAHDLIDEVLWIDRLVSTCYAAYEDSFELFTAACSLYFIAAIHSERQVARTGELVEGFLMKDNVRLRHALHQAELKIVEVNQAQKRAGYIKQLRANAIAWIRNELRPWNDVGLMEPGLHNRISRSFASKATQGPHATA